MREQLKGIALVLFGVLLCCADRELNNTVLANFSDFPFSLFGVLVGIVGVYLAFRKIDNK
jgi:hypothetical protein